jgi:hypothetical protein
MTPERDVSEERTDFYISIGGSGGLNTAWRDKPFMQRIEINVGYPPFVCNSRWFVKIWEAHEEEFWDERLDAERE